MECVPVLKEDTSTFLENVNLASPDASPATHQLVAKLVNNLFFFKETFASQDADQDIIKTVLSVALAQQDALCAKDPTSA